MWGGDHRLDWINTYPFNVLSNHFKTKAFCGHLKAKGDVVIGHDVWIASEAFILSGVTLEDGAVIAARFVVTQHIPPYVIFGGVSARLIKYRLDARI